LDIETKIELIRRPPTEEVLTAQDLKHLLETKEHPIAWLNLCLQDERPHTSWDKIQSLPLYMARVDKQETRRQHGTNKKIS